MLKLATLFILLFGHQAICFGQHITDENFTLIDDFVSNQPDFLSDTLDLVQQSTEGGQLISYQHDDKAYIVFDIWLFGETGKIHAMYWTDRNLKFKIVKRTDSKYDRPFYERGYKTTETTEYLSYVDNSVNCYDADRKLLKDSLVSRKQHDFEQLFKDAISEIKIVK